MFLRFYWSGMTPFQFMAFREDGRLAGEASPMTTAVETSSDQLEISNAGMLLSFRRDVV